MRLDLTEDAGLIRGVITHPRVYPSASDDGCPPADQFQPVIAPGIVAYLHVSEDGHNLGLFMLTRHNAMCVDLHTCLLPSAWGRKARQAATMCADWVWQNTTYNRIITEVASCNTLALRFALAGGMTEYGRNPGAWLKNGHLYDSILLGITRPGGETCQPQSPQS